MNKKIIKTGFKILSEQEIYRFVLAIDIDINNDISSRISVREYSEKLFNNAKVIAILSNSDELEGCLFYYDNNEFWYLTLIGVNKSQRGKDISKKLMITLHKQFKNKTKIILEVRNDNFQAISLYKSFGYKIVSSDDSHSKMEFIL